LHIPIEAKPALITLERQDLPMAYNEKIDLRIRSIVSNWRNTGARKMFGGVCHLLNGNMFCGVYKDNLILRLGKEKAQSALKAPHVKPFDITGKPMTGWVMVGVKGFKHEADLEDWLKQARAFAESLPPK
jgi:TfoX/Sxy family transcriptional regulator of competence genes